MFPQSEEPINRAAQPSVSIGQIIQSSVSADAGMTEKLMPRLVEAVRLHLGMEVGFISKFVDDRVEFPYVTNSGGQQAPKQGISNPLEGSTCLRIAKCLAPNLVWDAQTDPSLSDLSVIKELNIRSHISVPIPFGKDKVFGTLCCYSNNCKNDLQERDVGFMAVIADLIGAALQEEQRISKDILARRKYIRDVLSAGGLEMVWQPIVDVDTDGLAAVESLARFKSDPYRPPSEWFDEAEGLGIGTEVEKSAFILGVAIKEHLPEKAYVACNLSGAAFLDPTFQEWLRQQDLKKVVLEITEHDVIEDYEELASSLAEFRKQGLRLAIDDFGAGYASFRHIVELSPDIVKLDISLVRDINCKPSIQSVVNALTRFAKDQGVQLVAEGVETEAELGMLRSLGITRVQGYFFHKPMPQSQLFDLFRPLDQG
ncbi:MAG: sensor domain-containing phosphodiesterase [Marinobacter sp.]